MDCHQRQRVRHQEWIRAAVPRCWNCGGRLEPSATAYEGHLRHRTGKAEHTGRGRTPGAAGEAADQFKEGGDLS